MQKNENRLCPLPYEKVLEDIIKTVWTEQCGNLKEMRYHKLGLFCHPRGYFATPLKIDKILWFLINTIS